jgi:hypothetical protein
MSRYSIPIFNALPHFDNLVKLDSSQITTLESIAWQCPWSGGDAVFQARGLLSFVQDNVYDDSLLCLTQQYRIAEENLMAKELFVYPNPASDQVTIEFNSGLIGELSVFNSVGQIQYSKLISEDKKGITVHTVKWASGIYYCVLQHTDGTKYSASFVISR